MSGAPFDDLARDEVELSAGEPDGTRERFSDAVDERIFWLVSQRLALEAIADGGWTQLYRDPRDGRYWELTFPRGSLHGGGPRRLALVPREVAERRYGLSVRS